MDNKAHVVKENKFIIISTGKGEGELIWKEWALKLLLFIYVIRKKKLEII